MPETEQGPADLEQSRELHPVMWWHLWGLRFPTLQPLAVRLLSIPPSPAGGERIFKVLQTVLFTRPRRLAPKRVEIKTRLRFNTRQLERADVLAAFRRPTVELELRELLAGERGRARRRPLPPPRRSRIRTAMREGRLATTGQMTRAVTLVAVIRQMTPLLTIWWKHRA